MGIYIVLKKDEKLICRTMCSKPPAELIHGPRDLSISSLISKEKVHIPSGLPEFSLTPAPENSRDKEEWWRFLHFICKQDKVGLINLESDMFYILPPSIVPVSGTVMVAYQIDYTRTHPCPRDCESAGSHLAEECGGPEAFNGRGPANVADVCSPDHKSPPSQDRSFRFTAETFGFQSCVKIDRLREKNFVRADPSYLKTLGQVHSGWIFGGIAELVDNSRDAQATKIDIFVDMIKLKKPGKNVPMLSVIDDGHGMNHDEVMIMVSFGHKEPDKHDKDHIGRFGVGFKTGVMRIGRDVLVLTQTANSRSIAFLSQSLNEGKNNIEIPIVSYSREAQCMEFDTSVQPESLAKYNLNAIKKYSPFNEYLIGEKAALFGGGTGTQIFIWNLDERGSDYSLEWHDGLKGGSSFHRGDIFIRSRRSRSRPGQLNQKVSLDYSLRAYLEVIFLVPRMKLRVQGTLVKSRPLANFLTKTVIETGKVLGKPVELILGFSQLEWEQASCGMFLYWHGRLIEAYKRVGGMLHSADVGRGVIGVIDVTNLMDDQDGRVWVLNNKQGFQDSESYACLEEWLGHKADEYWDNNFDSLELDKDNSVCKPDCEWVQCDKCRKWRMLPPDFDIGTLLTQWFCYMEPFKGQCADAEQKMNPGTVNVSTKRIANVCMLNDSPGNKMEAVMETSSTDDESIHSVDVKSPTLKRLKTGFSKVEGGKSSTLKRLRKG